MSPDDPPPGTPGTRPPLVFISYGRPDSAIATEISEQLQARGIATWLDQKDLKAGDSWVEEIQKAARRSDVALILIGASDARPWQREELNALVVLQGQGRLRTIPVLLPGTPLQPTDLPMFLQTRHAIDFREGLRPEGLDRLRSDILNQPPPPPPVRATDPPRRWSRWVAALLALGAAVGLASWLIPEGPDGDPAADAVAPADRPPLPDARPAAVADAEPDARRPKTIDARPVRRPVPRPLPPRGIAVVPFDHPGAETLAQVSRSLPGRLVGSLNVGDCPVVILRNSRELRQGRHRYLLEGDLSEVNGIASMNARLLDVATRAVLGSSNARVTSPFFLAGEQKLVRELNQVIASKTDCLKVSSPLLR